MMIKESTNVRPPSLLVYVLETNHLAAFYLSTILTREPEITWTTIAARSLPGILLLGQKCVVVMDQPTWAALPPACVESVKAAFPSCGCILIGNRAGPEEIKKLMSEGISGFVLYADLEKQLASAVKSVARGSHSILELVLAPGIRHSYQTGMTRREKEVLALMINRRLANKEIASLLNIAETTVKFHVSNIFVKMRVSRRRELLVKLKETSSTMELTTVS